MNDRPQTLNEFTGQKKVVEQLDIAIKAARYHRKTVPHMVFGGPPGTGKTTLAAIVAKETNCRLVSRIATAIKRPEDLYELFDDIIESKENVILFIDEAEQLDRKITELLHTALEDFTLTKKDKNGSVEVELPWFTLIAATNYLGELPRPFLDRFGVQVNFETYTDEEITQLLIKARDRKKYNVSNNACAEIAKRSRGVPRVCLRLLDQVYDTAIAHEKKFWVQTKSDRFVPVVTRENVGEIFDILNIDDIGLTNLDRKVLEYLDKYNDQKIGLNSLAAFLNEDVSTVALVESYLMRKELLVRTPSGRMITEKGSSYLRKDDKSECVTQEMLAVTSLNDDQGVLSCREEVKEGQAC